jgi:hypothetical protein
MSTFEYKPLTADEVTFSIECEPEDLPVRGNAMASDDPAFDKRCEDEIIADLESGNSWAWCCIKVTATWKSWRADDYLGCCSYESEEDFKVGNSDYYETMRIEALARLNEEIKACAEELTARYEVTS